MSKPETLKNCPFCKEKHLYKSIHFGKEKLTHPNNSKCILSGFAIDVAGWNTRPKPEMEELDEEDMNYILKISKSAKCSEYDGCHFCETTLQALRGAIKHFGSPKRIREE